MAWRGARTASTAGAGVKWDPPPAPGPIFIWVYCDNVLATRSDSLVVASKGGKNLSDLNRANRVSRDSHY